VQFHSVATVRPGCGASDETGVISSIFMSMTNLIHGDSCNGINFATVDPGKGAVEAYNNVIYHVGVADPKDDGGAFSCIYVAGITNTGRAGTGTVKCSTTRFSTAAPTIRATPAVFARRV